MTSYPQQFLDRAKEFTGNEFDKFIASLSEPAPVSIRLNPFKRIEEFSTEEKIPWSKEGKYLSARPSFTFDPLFHAGSYYVQDASSQFLEAPFTQLKKLLDSPCKILDLCAAPGGKSTHLLSLINKEDLLVSNEVVPARNSILRQNIIKWGCANVIVTQNEPSDFNRLKGFFDVVLVDAPCSGEGLFRKDKDAIDEWSPEIVYKCSTRQNEILSYAYETLAPGGFLIYSTCTFEEEENDSQVNNLIQKFGLKKIDIENSYEGILTKLNGLAFFPHRIRGEGFYISLLQKESGEKYRIKNEKITGVKNNYKVILEEFLENPNEFYPVFKEGRLFAILNEHKQWFNVLSDNLYIRHAGINLGEIKGEDFIPSESVALSNYLRKDFSYIDFNEKQAIEYLKGGTPEITGAAKGWVIARFQTHALGWLKNLGNRINNYYPKPWRIKSDKSI